MATQGRVTIFGFLGLASLLLCHSPLLLGTNLSAGCCVMVGGRVRMKNAALIQLLSCPANRLRWPVVGDSRPGGNQGGAHTRFRAVGHRKVSKQLLNTSAGLVPTVVRNELIVHGHLVQSKEPTILRSSLEPGLELCRTNELRA
jgi:hypothetical protein